MKLDAGVVVDSKFEILEPKGRGANGATFVARQVGLERTVVLKTIFQSDATGRKRFLREAYALSLISHPNVVAFYGYGTWQDQPYLAMELVHGTSLEQLLTGASLSLQSLLSIAGQISAGLECLHKNGIVHRDFTPMNIVVNELDTGEYTVKIIDLGLAKVVGEHRHLSANQLTEAGQALGSVMYMSPEQCRGIQADAKSDIYSLGCILYRMFAGSPPYSGESAITLMLHHTESDFPNLPVSANARIASKLKRLNALIDACTAKEASERPSAEDVLGEIDAIADLVQREKIGTEMIAAPAAAVTPPYAVPRIRSRMSSKQRYVLGALFVLVVMAATAFCFTHIFEPRSVEKNALSNEQSSHVLACLGRTARDAQETGNWEGMKEPLWRAVNGIPLEWPSLTPALAEQAEAYYTHTTAQNTDDGFGLSLAANMTIYAQDHHDLACARRWLARALNTPPELLRRAESFVLIGRLCGVARAISSPEDVATLCEYYFAGLKTTLASGAPNISLHTYTQEIRLPFDCAMALDTIQPNRRKALWTQVDDCLISLRAKAKNPEDVTSVEQYQAELSQAAGNFQDACRHFKQALAVEPPLARKTPDAVRTRVELAVDLDRCGKHDEARAVALDAVRLSELISDKRASIVALRVYANFLVEKDAASPAAYEASRTAYVTASQFQQAVATQALSGLAQRSEAIALLDSVTPVYMRALRAQSKTNEIDELNQHLQKIGAKVY